MNNAFSSFFQGLIIGSVGTSLGGFISLYIRKPNKKLFSSLLMFTAGLMLSIISFDLLPEAFEIGGIFVELLGLVNGLILIFLVEELIPINKLKSYPKKKQNYIRMSLMILISLSLHNLPEGLALGSSYIYSSDIGFKIAILIALHNIPEGISIGIPLTLSGIKPINIILLTFISGLPTALGAFAGSILGNLSDYFISYCLASAASTMLYVVCREIIPEASNMYNGRITAVFLIVGFITGCYLSFAI